MDKTGMRKWTSEFITAKQYSPKHSVTTYWDLPVGVKPSWTLISAAVTGMSSVNTWAQPRLKYGLSCGRASNLCSNLRSISETNVVHKNAQIKTLTVHLKYSTLILNLTDSIFLTLNRRNSNTIYRMLMVNGSEINSAALVVHDHQDTKYINA
jgi:hypothetical protein